MIIGLQSALLCDDVEHDPDKGISYIGVLPSTVFAATKPDGVPLCIVLHLVSDGAPSAAVMTVAAPQWSERFTFPITGGLDVTGAMFSLIVPIIEAGELRVTVENLDGRGRPLRTKWKLAFQPDAKPIAMSAKDILAAAHASVEEMRTNIANRSS